MPREDKSPYQIYDGAQRSAQPLRLAESLAFSRAAAALEAAIKPPLQRARFEAALKKNQLLWTMVQAECTSPGNRLPPAVKDNLLTLSLFVDRQTVTALTSFSAADVESLIDIDRDMAEGLRANHRGR